MDKQYDPNVTPKKQVFSAQIDLKKFEKATDEEKKQQDVMSESTTFFRDGMRKLMKNPLAVLSLVLLVIILITIIVAPMIVPYKYEEIMSINGKRDKGAKNLAPFTYSKMEQQYIDQGGTRFPHIFGTDEQCRDYFIRVVYGTRVSLSIGVFASLIVLIIGMIYGSISGYVGGRTDLIMMRIVDIIYSLPDMLVIILISVVLDQVLDLTGSYSSSIFPAWINSSITVLCSHKTWMSIIRLALSCVSYIAIKFYSSVISSNPTSCNINNLSLCRHSERR